MGVKFQNFKISDFFLKICCKKLFSFSRSRRAGAKLFPNSIEGRSGQILPANV